MLESKYIFTSYKGDLSENNTWYHGTKREFLPSILLKGVLNGKRGALHTFARGPQLSASFGQSKDGVVIAVQPSKGSLLADQIRPKPEATYALNAEGKVFSDDILFWVSTERVQSLIEQLTHDFKDHYNDGVDISAAYIEKFAEILLQFAHKKDGSTISEDESIQYSCEMVWNQFERTFQKEIDSLLGYISLLRMGGTLGSTSERVAQIMRVWGSNITLWKTERYEDLGYDTRQCDLADYIQKFFDLWERLKNVNLAYPEIEHDYEEQLNEIKNSSLGILGILEEARNSLTN